MARMAWGRTTEFMVWRRLNPSDRPASTWPGGMDWMPPRKTSAM